MRKVTRGRKYCHQKQEILLGHSIMISIGSPKKAAELGTIPYQTINGQFLNRIDYIPFVRTKIDSGKKSHSLFLKDLKSHEEKVIASIQKFEEKIGITTHSQPHIHKTSKIISLNKR